MIGKGVRPLFPFWVVLRRWTILKADAHIDRLERPLTASANGGSRPVAAVQITQKQTLPKRGLSLATFDYAAFNFLRLPTQPSRPNPTLTQKEKPRSILSAFPRFRRNRHGVGRAVGVLDQRRYDGRRRRMSPRGPASRCDLTTGRL